MARRTYRSLKRYGMQSTLRSKGFVVLKRNDFEDDDRDDIIGQPDDRSEVAKNR